MRTRVAENKILIVKLGGLEPLIRQMLSPNVEVQCNAVGCITNLATHGQFLPYVSPLCVSRSAYTISAMDRVLQMRTRRRLRNRVLWFL